MPELHRRSFLQMLGAAGVMPLVPARAIAATAGTGGASSSQMLWASLNARAGSPANFMGLTQGMGISNTAAQGIHATILQKNIVVAQGAAKVGRITQKTTTPISEAQPKTSLARKKPDFDLDALLDDDAEDDIAPIEADEASDADVRDA